MRREIVKQGTGLKFTGAELLIDKGIREILWVSWCEEMRKFPLLC